MQFDYFYKEGTPLVFVKFLPHKVTGQALVSIIECLFRIGGEMQENVSTWTFPLLVSRVTITTIIANTCFKCGGLMEDGIAIVNGKVIVESYDSAVDTYQGTIEYRDPKNFKQIKVRKCQVCGHSHT